MDQTARKNKGNPKCIPKGGNRTSARDCAKDGLDTELRSTGQGGRDERTAEREVVTWIASDQGCTYEEIVTARCSHSQARNLPSFVCGT